MKNLKSVIEEAIESKKVFYPMSRAHSESLSRYIAYTACGEMAKAVMLEKREAVNFEDTLFCGAYNAAVEDLSARIKEFMGN